MMLDPNIKIAPRFEILIDSTIQEIGDFQVGTDITSRILNLEVDFDIDATTEILVTADDRDNFFSEKKVFAEGNLIHVYMGYDLELEHVASCEVVAWEPSYPRDGIQTLRIRAHDILHRFMDRAEHPGGVHRNSKDSDIAKHLIEDHMKLESEIDLTEVIHNRVQKKGVSDYHHLKRLALINNYYLWADYDIKKHIWSIYWKDKEKVREKQEEKYSFYWNNNSAVSLLDFNANFHTREQISGVEVVNIDTNLKKPIKSIVKEEKKGQDVKFVDDEPIENEIKSGSSIVFTAFEQRFEVITNKKFKNKKAAQIWVEKYLKNRNEEFLTGSGTVIGTPSLRPRQVHWLGGLGARLSGEWELTHVRHMMGSNRSYETEFTARKLFDPSNPKSGVAKVPVVERFISKTLYGL